MGVSISKNSYLLQTPDFAKHILNSKSKTEASHLEVTDCIHKDSTGYLCIWCLEQYASQATTQRSWLDHTQDTVLEFQLHFFIDTNKNKSGLQTQIAALKVKGGVKG